jgi:hypothetical protein
MNDLAAIKKCRARDWEAYRYLVEKYQARAIGHALAIVGNREDSLWNVNSTPGFIRFSGIDVSSCSPIANGSR